jgi:3-hydroxyisobutyrate dehydrogenase-like beta-hydroxyacid dehydrogenase
MPDSASRTALIGFGEAGIAFAEDLGPGAGLAAFDIKTLDPATAAAKRRDYERLGVAGAATLAAAVAPSDLLISVVTADQALAAAAEAAAFIAPGAFYCDFNSVAPETKRRAAALIAAAGGFYADVAVMAPVLPSRLAVPLLVSGPHAKQACARLRRLGFVPREAGEEIGRASTIKMLRSVMVKGIEALTAECFIACRRAGVLEDVAASLDASWPGVDWAARADYNLDRMMVHGLRRAAEMDEVARTLADLGLPNAMSLAAAAAQRRIGALGIEPADGLEAKASAILATKCRAAA